MNIRSLPVPGIEQLQEWGPKLASALLVIAISYTLTQLVWHMTGNAGVTVTLPAPTTEFQSSQSRNQAVRLAGEISSAHLFGHAAAQAGDEVISAPETKLNLNLLGILSIGEKNGLAIIAGGGQQEKVYKVGERIPGNVTLKAVYADRVLLEGSGGLETLMLPKEGGLVTFTGPNDRPTGPGKPAFEPGQDQTRQIAPDQTPQVSPGDLGEIRNKLSRNPAEIQKMAKVSQAMEGDKVIGYKLQPGPDSAMYRALGLEDGDIVTSVNGIDLTRPENGIRALQKLRRAKQIDATILRNGQEMQISRSLDD
jgi:general secretion pathway protein C